MRPTKIHDFHHLSVVDHNVTRGEVSVQDTVLVVHVVQRLAKLDKNAPDPLLGHVLSLFGDGVEVLCKRRAADILHDNVETVIPSTSVASKVLLERDDVWMSQSCGDQRWMRWLIARISGSTDRGGIEWDGMAWDKQTLENFHFPLQLFDCALPLACATIFSVFSSSFEVVV